jgi:phage terminase large subunit
LLRVPDVAGLIPSERLLGSSGGARIVLPYTPSPTQRSFHALLPLASVRLYGGAMGGGKTYAVCGEGISLLCRWPGNRIAYIRKTRTAIERTTWRTFLRLLPFVLIRTINAQKLTVTLVNGSEAIFLGADTSKDPLLEDLKSFEASMIYLEEASQLAEDVFFTAIQRKDRWITPDGSRPPGGVALTTNPEIGWVKTTIYDPWSRGELPDGMAFVPALPSDNPELGEQYLADMRRFLPPDQIARYLEGKWEAPDDPSALIAYAHLRAAMDADEPGPTVDEWIGVDVAYEGDDDSEIWRVRWDGSGAWSAEHLQSLSKADEITVAEAVQRHWLASGTRGGVIVDANGIGSGVATILSRSGIRRLIRFKDGSKAGHDPQGIAFRNLGDQAHWHLRCELAAGRGRLPEDARLIEELAGRRYRVDPGGRQVEVERKLEYKKRLHRSPDRADAVRMGVFAPRIAKSTGVGVMIVGGR